MMSIKDKFRTYILQPSTRIEKKWMIITPNGKKIHFGQKGYFDYTQHGDLDRKKQYLLRHISAEDWTNLNTAGSWSRWLLWNKDTLESSIADMERRFGIRILYHHPYKNSR